MPGKRRREILAYHQDRLGTAWVACPEASCLVLACPVEACLVEVPPDPEPRRDKDREMHEDSRGSSRDGGRGSG